MSKHTPWYIHAADDHITIRAEDTDGIVATIEDGGLLIDTAPPTFSREEMDAHARLIAAAPDLLAALKTLRPMVGSPDGHTVGDVWRAQKQADDAIAKAQEE